MGDITNEYNIAISFALITESLCERWSKTNEELSEIYEKYDILEFIKVNYSVLNLMGMKGILEEIENYIKKNGGSYD